MNIRIVVTNLLPGSFDGLKREADTKEAGKRLLYLLNALAAVNVSLWRPEFAPLYSSGVVYQREGSTEDWLSLPDLYSRRAGDCEDLACARVAELRIAKKRAYPRVTWKPVDNGQGGTFWLYHVIVMRQKPDVGEIIPGAKVDREILKPGPHGWWYEDPSRVLGMTGRYHPKGTALVTPVPDERMAASGIGANAGDTRQMLAECIRQRRVYVNEDGQIVQQCGHSHTIPAQVHRFER